MLSIISDKRLYEALEMIQVSNYEIETYEVKFVHMVRFVNGQYFSKLVSDNPKS